MNEVDILDARLWAEAKFQEWKAEFEKEYGEPAADLIRAKNWQGIPPDEKEKIKRDKPELYKRMEDKYGV